MAASQVDERLLVQLRDRAAERAREWRPRAEVVDVVPLTGGTSVPLGQAPAEAVSLSTVGYWIALGTSASEIWREEGPEGGLTPLSAGVAPAYPG